MRVASPRRRRAAGAYASCVVWLADGVEVGFGCSNCGGDREEQGGEGADGAELEMECMRVYRRKVDEATAERASLHQSLAAGEAEIAALTAALGADSSPQLKVTFEQPYTLF